MKMDTIIAYNEKILDLVLSNSSFNELIFRTFPNGKELTRLKNNFDLLGVRTGKSRLKQDEIKKIIYYSAIGTLDDKNRCRSKELKKTIARLINRFVKDPKSFRMHNQLEELTFMFLVIRECFINTVLDNIIIRIKKRYKNGKTFS